MTITQMQRVEVRSCLTGAAWQGQGCEEGDGLLRVTLNTGELGVLPTWHPGATVECIVLAAGDRRSVATGTVVACGLESVVVRLSQPLRPDHRRHARVVCAIPVKFASSGRHQSGICLNLGVGGMCIRSDGPLSVGAHVFTELLLPGAHEPLHIVGEVVYSGPAARGHGYESGLSFGQARPAELDLLRAYVRAQSED